MRHGLLRSTVLSLVLSGVLPCACRKDEPGQVVLPAGAVGRCEAGIRKATTKPTAREAMSIYYDECADLYSEAGCRDAFHAAAHAESREQLSIVLQGCRSAYCPLLGAGRYEACNDSFQVTPESAVRAWPPIAGAILAHEAGAYSGELTNAVIALYAYTMKLGGADQAGSASAGAPASAVPSSEAAPSSSGETIAGATGSAAPSAASVAPPGSASVAPPAKAKKAQPR